MPRLSTSSLIPSQVPDFVRSEYPTFVAFVEAYYEYLDTQGIDLKTLKDLDITLDTFIGYFKKELAQWRRNPQTVDNPDGVWLHPDDVTGNIRRIEALNLIINDFGKE